MKKLPFPTKISPSKKRITEELENLQQSSWNLELLFSAVALLVLEKCHDLAPQFYKVAENIATFEIPSGIAVFAGHLGIRMALSMLTFSLILHIVFRGFWIALIGLRYVSGEVDVKALHYNKPFAKRARAGVTYDAYIERVEKACSVIYAFIFLVLFFILSFFVTLLFFLSFAWIIDQLGVEDFWLADLLGWFILIPLVLYLVDTLTLGGLQRLKRPAFVGLVYSPFHKVMQYLTLSVLYRPLFHNFMDNKYSRRLAISILPVILIFIFQIGLKYQPSGFYPSAEILSSSSIQGRVIMSNHYDNERSEDSPPHLVHFPSRYVDGHTAELKIVYKAAMEKDFLEAFPEYEEKKSEIGLTWGSPDYSEDLDYNEFMDRFTSMFTISVEDSVYSNLKFKIEQHDDEKELNFTTVLDVNHLPYGFIHVKVEYLTQDTSADSLVSKTVEIPLIKR